MNIPVIRKYAPYISLIKDANDKTQYHAFIMIPIEVGKRVKIKEIKKTTKKYEVEFLVEDNSNPAANLKDYLIPVANAKLPTNRLFFLENEQKAVIKAARFMFVAKRFDFSPVDDFNPLTFEVSFIINNVPNLNKHKITSFCIDAELGNAMDQTDIATGYPYMYLTKPIVLDSNRITNEDYFPRLLIPTKNFKFTSGFENKPQINYGKQGVCESVLALYPDAAAANKLFIYAPPKVNKSTFRDEAAGEGFFTAMVVSAVSKAEAERFRNDNSNQIEKRQLIQNMGAIQVGALGSTSRTGRIRTKSSDDIGGGGVFNIGGYFMADQE